jgi:DNA primase
VDDTVSEILRRANLEALIGQYVELKHIGSRLRGKCPFHQEKTPSFYVSVDKGLWHCFGCKAGGNVFQFVMQIEHLTFPEAVEFLANKMGVRVVRKRGRETVSPREAIYKALADAADFFHSRLVASPGESALEYLHNRGINDAAIRAFRLGLAPGGWDGLIKHLTERGVKMPALVEAGLVVQSREDKTMRDYFRGRLMFPVSNITGRVVGFGARALGDEIPKYLNTAGTTLYQKGDVLYGLSLTKGDIAKAKSAIFVEGYMDLIALYQAGVTNVVATCGTALTPAHIGLIRRFAENIYLAFDGDEAGVSAVVKSARLFLSQGEEAKIVPMPAGTDPDDLVRKKGREAFDERVKGAMTLPAFVIAVRRSREKLDSAAKRKLLSEMAPIFREIKSEMLQREYIDQTASLLLIDPKFVYSLVAPMPERVGRAVLPSFSRTEVLTVGSKKIEREILKAILKDESNLAFARRVLKAEMFADDAYRRLYLRLIAQGDDEDSSDSDVEPIRAELILEAEAEPNPNLPVLLARLADYDLGRRIDETQRLLKEQEMKGNSEEVATLAARQSELTAQRKLLRSKAAAAEQAGGKRRPAR